MRVHVVWHIHHIDRALDTPHLDEDGSVSFDEGIDDEKLIGIYSSREQAERAVERSARLDGFRDEPECFMINEHVVDEDNWTTGFFAA